MKKIITILCFSIIFACTIQEAQAVNIGTYKTETEYGLLDGFKINWKRKDKSQPFIEPREESTKKEYEKEYKDYTESEYERTQIMYRGMSVL